MSRFERTTFGLEAVNTITGAVEIAGGTNLSILFLEGIGATPVTNLTSITTSMIHLDASGASGGAWIINLPPLASVPLGTVVTFKRDDSGHNIAIKGGLSQIDNLLLATGMRIYNDWHGATLYNDGTRWLIIEYFDGTI